MNLIYGWCGLGFENNFILTFSDLYFSFKNDICPGTGDIDGRSGVCWTKEECAALKGIADGGCASGYGVCCICKCKFLWSSIGIYGNRGCGIFKGGIQN